MARSWAGERGFLTFAIGGDYLEHARAQALSIKISQIKINNFAVIIDKSSSGKLQSCDHRLFDEVIFIDHDPDDWDMSKEWMALALTPWRETIKTDADMLFPSSIDHWWNSLCHRDVVLAANIRDFRGDRITSRQHRKLFDINLLPDVYSAITYFRYSQLAVQFFDIVKKITHDWDYFANDMLLKNDDKRLRTDELYALAAKQLGPEQFILPIDTIPTFVHMKERLNGLGNGTPWYEQIDSYYTGERLFVGNIAQTLPFHYHQKGWIKDDRLDRAWRHYEKLFRSHGETSQRD